MVPGGSTLAEPSAAELQNLSETIRESGIPAIFTETTHPDELAEAVAAEVGSDIEVIELYSDALGEPGSDGGTYIDMLRTNASRISAALSA